MTPPPTPESTTRNVLQGMQSLLELSSPDQDSITVPRFYLMSWVDGLNAVLDLLRQDPSPSPDAPRTPWAFGLGLLVGWGAGMAVWALLVAVKLVRC